MDTVAKTNPTKGYLLVEPRGNEQSGSFTFKTTETPQRGKVLKVGPDTWHAGIAEVFTSPCKEGDTIIHGAHNFETIRIENKEYRLVPFGMVLAVIGDNNA